MPLFPYIRDKQRTKGKKTNLKFPAIILVVVLIIIIVSKKKAEERFPYLILEGNILITIEQDNKREINTKKDTITAIYKETNVLLRRKSQIGLFFEKRNDFKEKTKIIDSKVISNYTKFPFFSLIDDKDNGTSEMILNFESEITKTIFPLELGLSWLDEDIGLLSKFVKYDTLQILGRDRECYKIIRYLNKDTRNNILSQLKSNPNIYNNDELIKSVKRNINSLWTEWYSKDIGWVKSKYPNGNIETIINIEELYWYERIPRIFGIGVR